MEETKDSRISKLIHKARRIVDIYVSDAAKATEQKETVQGFISDLSHQMKTPLSGITMYADLLLEGNIPPEETMEFLYRIKSSSEKLQWLMGNLIKMSRLEIDAIQLKPTQLSIKKTISDSIESVIPAATKRNINLIVSDFPDTLLYHDRTWTREAIVNVLENAIKYSPQDSEIEITAEQYSFYTKLTITDHGIGIVRDDWNFIFQRFYRGNNAMNIEGTGLGLYLVTLIMEKQGGYVMVDSKPEEFTSISLFLQNCKM